MQALLERPVGAAVDGDDQRAHVADVGAQRLEVAAVAVAADDDQHVAVAEARPGRRELDGAGQQIGLAAHVGDRVLGELGERLVDPLALLVELALELDRAEHPAAQDRLAAGADRAALDPQPLAVAEQLERVALLDVDEHHPGAGEQQRPGVRVAAVGGLGRVDHRPHPGRDQLLGGDPVDVEVVDDRDVARAPAA